MAILEYCLLLFINLQTKQIMSFNEKWNSNHILIIEQRFAILHEGAIKKWELRFDDRKFKQGEFIEFIVIDDNTQQPTGHVFYRRILDVFNQTEYGLQEGYVILSLSPLY